MTLTSSRQASCKISRRKQHFIIELAQGKYDAKIVLEMAIGF